MRSTLPMSAGLYAIRCTVTGEQYIGATGKLRRRKAQHMTHLYAGQHSCKPLQKLFNKYGREGFQFIVLESIPEGLSAQETTARLYTLERKALRDPEFRNRLNQGTQSYVARAIGKKSIASLLADLRVWCQQNGAALRDELEEAIAAHLLKRVDVERYRPFVHGKAGRPRKE